MHHVVQPDFLIWSWNEYCSFCPSLHLVSKSNHNIVFIWNTALTVPDVCNLFNSPSQSITATGRILFRQPPLPGQPFGTEFRARIECPSVSLRRSDRNRNTRKDTPHTFSRRSAVYDRQNTVSLSASIFPWSSSRSWRPPRRGHSCRAPSVASRPKNIRWSRSFSGRSVWPPIPFRNTGSSERCIRKRWNNQRHNQQSGSTRRERSDRGSRPIRGAMHCLSSGCALSGASVFSSSSILLLILMLLLLAPLPGMSWFRRGFRSLRRERYRCRLGVSLPPDSPFPEPRPLSPGRFSRCASPHLPTLWFVPWFRVSWQERYVLFWWMNWILNRSNQSASIFLCALLTKKQLPDPWNIKKAEQWFFFHGNFNLGLEEHLNFPLLFVINSPLKKGLNSKNGFVVAIPNCSKPYRRPLTNFS